MTVERSSVWGDRWNRFWHASGSTLNLALFRIAFSVCLWREVDTSLGKSKMAIEGGFHLPYVSFFGPYPEGFYAGLHYLQYPLILLLGLGLLMRVSIAGLLLLQGAVFFADQLVFRNHPYFFGLLLLLLLFSPANDALSIKAIVRGWRQRRPFRDNLLGGQAPLTCQRMIQVEVCLSYIWAAIHKTTPLYLSGAILGDILGDDMFEKQSGAFFRAVLSRESFERFQELALSRPSMMAASWFTVMAEYLLPFALLYRRTRLAAIVIGIGFHGMIAFTMNIKSFSLAMVGSYLLFVEPDWLPTRLRRWLGLGAPGAAAPGTAARTGP